MILKRLSMIALLLGVGTSLHATNLQYEIVKKQNERENIELSYPKFQEEWLNEMIEKPILITYNERVGSELYQDDAFYYGLESDVLGSLDSIVTIRAIEQEFAGGAHGIMATNLHNIDLDTQKEVTFDDLFQSDSAKKALADLGKRYFEEQYADEVRDNLITFEDGFVLSNQYGFTNEGLIFIYGANSIAPSYLGEVEFTIPYDELSRVVPEDSKLYPLIKAQFSEKSDK